MARGSRSLGSFTGFLFYEGEEYTKDYVEKLCVQFEGEDLKDYVLIVKIVRAWYATKPSRAAILNVKSVLSETILLTF